MTVVELDGQGALLRSDVYDPEQIDQALARFAELATPQAAIPKSNAASAFTARWEAAFNARDWEALRAVYRPDVRWEDRRRLFQLVGDLDLAMASMRERAETGARAECRVMGIAGDRVLAQRVLWSGGPADGRFEIDTLAVVEVDETGRAKAVIVFDPDDSRAAQHEAWTRWAAIDPVAAPWVELFTGIVHEGFDGTDWERIRTFFADDVVVEDHRRTGIGRIEGADAYLDTVRVLWALAPDQRIELGWFWPAVEPHGVVTTLKRLGTLADGGAFESDALWLCSVAGGRVTRAEMFEVEDLDKALGRLAELRPDGLPTAPTPKR
jgi:ketosteroid isomerase-like protein